MQPQQKEQQTELQDQLARQGISVGNQAYSNAETQLGTQQNQQTLGAVGQAVQGGEEAAQNMFNMALTGQQQNLSQQETAQSNPISLLQQLMGAAPATPTQPLVPPTPTSVSPTDVVGATGIYSNAAQQSYAAQLAQQNAMFGGLAGLGGAGLMALSLS